MLDPAHSLGKFVNNVLKDRRVRCYGSPTVTRVMPGLEAPGQALAHACHTCTHTWTHT